MKHTVAHLTVGLGLYRAGLAMSKRRRTAWLVAAAAACLSCHNHHHPRSNACRSSEHSSTG